MSAYLVEDKTINNILNCIYLNNRDFSKYACRPLNAAGFKTETENDLTALGKAMLRLNSAALNARYGEDVQDIPFSFQLRSDVRDLQAFKSLECWLYQCSEGDIPRESVLFRLMDKFAADLAVNIIKKSSEYLKLNWG